MGFHLNTRIPFLFCILFLLVLLGCDGFRYMRADIDLKSEKPEYDYKKPLQLIDGVSERHNLKCSLSKDEFFRYCGAGFVHLVSRVDPKTGIFAIDLSEFGPIGATKQYRLLHKEISDLIQKNFSKDSVTLNPVRCTPYFSKYFLVKLHDRRPKLLYFVPWSIEPEFSEALAAIEPLAKANSMKESNCYTMRKTDKCKLYSGGDYIGVEESVTFRIYGDSAHENMNVKLTDRSCKESKLTKLLYEELLKQLTDLFGGNAITIPAEKKR